MVWSRSLRVFLVVVLVVALTALVHSTGAELSWSKFAGPSLFDRYQVYRGTAAGFALSPSTLLATIRDVDTTGWVDTTAAPSPSAAVTKSFWYKVDPAGLFGFMRPGR